MLAAASLYLAHKISQESMATYIPLYPVEDNDFKEIVKGLSLILPYAHEKKNYKAIYKKFNLEQFHNVAIICKNVC